MNSQSRQDRPWAAIAFPLVLVLTLWAFWPALSGPFLLDDEVNLAPIGKDNGLDSVDALTHFVFSGQAGPLGRPLALLSFAANAQDWPASPWPFKYTNLLLHLLNGCLLAWLALKLARQHLDERHAEWVAVLSAAIWLLHPIQLSTLMLVVQRMTELSATFVIAGLLAYTHGRQRHQHAPRSGWIWMTTGVVAGSSLAVLSKETGALLPLYALVLESTLLRTAPIGQNSYWCWWRRIFLFAPVWLMVLYMAWRWPAYMHTYLIRDFTVGERLLTEPRVLFEYLQSILLPRASATGLFHDGYPFSTGLFAPPTTALAIGALLALAGAALLLRKRVPLFSLAVLWFLAGHVLESTIAPLELYFDHRNYLPMWGMIFASVHGVFRAAPQWRRIGAFACTGFLAISAFVTATSSPIWGNKEQLATVWAAENPNSGRAQQLAADYWSRNGDFKRAYRYIQQGAEANPRAPGLHLQLLQLGCLLNELPPVLANQTIAMLPTARYDNAVYATLDKLVGMVDAKQCRQLDFDQLETMIGNLLSNPAYGQTTSARRNLYYTLGMINFYRRRLSPAMEAMDKAYDAVPDANIPLLQAVWLASAGLPDDAQRYLDKAKRTAHGHLTSDHTKQQVRQLEAQLLQMRSAEDR